MLAGLIAFTLGLRTTSHATEVWLCAGNRHLELMRPDAEWPFVKQHLSGTKIYVDQVNRATPE